MKEEERVTKTLQTNHTSAAVCLPSLAHAVKPVSTTTSFEELLHWVIHITILCEQADEQLFRALEYIISVYQLRRLLLPS